MFVMGSMKGGMFLLVNIVDLMDILPLLHDECLVIYNLCQCVGVEMFLHFNHLYIFFSKLEVVVIYKTVDGRNPAPPRMYKTL